MATNTTNYNLIKPGVGDPTDQDLWGGYINTSFDIIDDQLLEARQKIVSSKTGDYTITEDDINSVIVADTSGISIDITLPSAVTVGNGFNVIVVKKASANTATLEPFGSEKISGEDNYVLSGNGETASLTSDGANWVVYSQSRASSIPTRQYITATGAGSINVPEGVTRIRVTGSGAGGGGHGADGNICTAAGDGGLTSVTYNGVTATANGGKGGLFCNADRPASAIATATGGDINISGGGSVGGNSGTNGNNAVKDGEPGALFVKDFIVTPGASITYTVGAGGTKLEVIGGMATDGVGGYIIFEW